MASIKVFGQLELGSNDKGLVQSKDVYHGNLPLNQVITELQNSGGSSGSFEIPELDLQGITMPGNVETGNYFTAPETPLDDYGVDLSNVDTIRQSPIIYIKNTAELADTIYYVAYKVCADEENSTYIIYTGDGINDGREPTKCGILYLSSTDICTIRLYVDKSENNVVSLNTDDVFGKGKGFNVGTYTITKDIYDKFNVNTSCLKLYTLDSSGNKVAEYCFNVIMYYGGSNSRYSFTCKNGEINYNVVVSANSNKTYKITVTEDYNQIILNAKDIIESWSVLGTKEISSDLYNKIKDSFKCEIIVKDAYNNYHYFDRIFTEYGVINFIERYNNNVMYYAYGFPIQLTFDKSNNKYTVVSEIYTKPFCIIDMKSYNIKNFDDNTYEITSDNYSVFKEHFKNNDFVGFRFIADKQALIDSTNDGYYFYKTNMEINGEYEIVATMQKQDGVCVMTINYSEDTDKGTITFKNYNYSGSTNDKTSNSAKVVEIDYISIVGSTAMNVGEWDISKELYDQFDDNVVGINLKMNMGENLVYNYYIEKYIHVQQNNLHSYAFYNSLIEENNQFVIAFDGTNYKFGIQSK